MRRVVSLLIMLKGISVSVDAVAEVPFNGRSGEGLLAAVAEASRPSAVVDRSRLTFRSVDEFTGEVSRWLPGGCLRAMSGGRLSLPSGGGIRRW